MQDHAETPAITAAGIFDELAMSDPIKSKPIPATPDFWMGFMYFHELWFGRGFGSVSSIVSNMR
jgi:hypothetical protein